jgi:tRNA modification GTPase
MIQNDSIIALATPSGIGAISVIRISGEDAINIVSKKFNSISGKRTKESKNSHHTFRTYY